MKSKKALAGCLSDRINKIYMKAKKNLPADYLVNHVNPVKLFEAGKLDIMHTQRLLISGIQLNGKAL
jgi:hypothetical protein